jgi:plastocyanin
MKKICKKWVLDFDRGALTLIALLTAITLVAWSASGSDQVGGLIGLVQAASTPESVGSATEIKIDNFVFQPAQITIKAGTQVSWTNKDDIPHTVDSTDGKFKSAALDTDEKFQFRFTEPGEYPFYCRMHPKMTGKIVVQP